MGAVGGERLGWEGTITTRRTKPRLRPGSCQKRLRLWQGLRAGLLCSAAVVAGGLIAAQPTAAQQANSQRDTFGEIGILDMPSAHMASDGQLAFVVGATGPARRYNLTFQVLPWLEGTFRYSHVDPYPRDWDRSFSMKIRLSREGDNVPDISVGIRDLLGTGIYSSEYLTASKHFGNLDLTAGLGWGRLAGDGTLPNPLGQIFSSVNTRAKPAAITGGAVNLGQFFHGPKVGVFGGAIWQTPIDGLSLLAEYSSDKYSREGQRRGVKVRSPVNVGLSYKVANALTVSAGWFYGSTYGFTVNLNGDPGSEAPSAQRVGPKVPPPAIRDDSEQRHALSLILNRNAYIAAQKEGGPWIRLPTEAERSKLDLTQALVSEGRGVRDIDIEGTTLVINAHRLGKAPAQCARYSDITSAVGTRVTSIAMIDLQDSDGLVTFCPITNQTQYAQNVVRGGSATDGTAVNATGQAALERTLRADLGKQSLLMEALSLGQSELWIYYENSRYRKESEAAGRIIRVLMADAPPSVEIFHLIPTTIGVPMQEITVVRSALERTTLAHATTSGLGDAIALGAPPLDNPPMDYAAKDFFPFFYWSLDPKLTENVFDPLRPVEFKVYAVAGGGIALAPGLTVGVGLSANIWNNYIFKGSLGSKLPHVRTDLLQYNREGANGIAGLLVDYRTRLARDVLAEVKAGYLEDMYMGVGGQVLWRPENSRIALGVDIYQVWQRDFNRLFGLRDYHVFTGHATLYYRSPWHGLNFNVHVGRYLAGDYGATFELTRQFSTGVEIGAYATFTNVPFRKFGEGSFDKGIILHIPFEWGLPLYSQSSYDVRMSALTRDGGQRLNRDDSLYEDTRGTSYGEIAQTFDDLVEP